MIINTDLRDTYNIHFTSRMRIYDFFNRMDFLCFSTRQRVTERRTAIRLSRVFEYNIRLRFWIIKINCIDFSLGFVFFKFFICSPRSNVSRVNITTNYKSSPQCSNMAYIITYKYRQNYSPLVYNIITILY